MGNNKNLILEIWDFLKVRKAWWALPIIISLVAAGMLVVFVQSSPVSPLIYAMF